MGVGYTGCCKKVINMRRGQEFVVVCRESRVRVSRQSSVTDSIIHSLRGCTTVLCNYCTCTVVYLLYPTSLETVCTVHSVLYHRGETYRVRRYIVEVVHT